MWSRKWRWKLLSHVWIFVTPWTVQSMEFSRPEYWSGYPFPSPGDLPNPGFLALQADCLHKRSPSILGWVAYPFSRGSSQPRNWTRVSCIAGGFFTNWAIGEARMWSWLTSFTSLDVEQVHLWNGAIHPLCSQSSHLSRGWWENGMFCKEDHVIELNDWMNIMSSLRGFCVALFWISPRWNACREVKGKE